MSNELNTNSMMTNHAYTLDQIKAIAPSVFTTDKAPHLTDKYIQTPTSRVVEDLMNLGWQVTKAQEVKSRKYKGFQKHIVVFRNPNITIKGKDGDNVSIRHTNYTFESLQTKIGEMIAKLPNLVQKINLFKTTELTEDQMKDFATKAMQLRTKQRVNIMDVLNADRPQDQGNDLWVVFNRVQEKLVGGSYKAGQRKARSVKNFQKDIEINEQLFELAESYL